MIKEKIYYVTDDGSEFKTYEQAQKYEDLYARCESIMGQLRPHEIDGAVMQDTFKIRKAYIELMELCAETIPQFDWVFKYAAENGIKNASHANRVINDFHYKCLCHAFFRFECTNFTSGIEYEQPYYVDHEDEWKKVIY